VVSFALLGLGCKKEIDPSAFDAGVTSTAASAAPSASAPEPTAADPAATDVAPLAPLSSATTPKPPPAAAKPGTAAKPATPAAAPIAECAKAKQFCEHPAVKTDTAIQGLCAKYKDECTKKGGHP
jgi:sec-independent protein translocase protein TatB